MNRLVWFLRGFYRIRIRGAAPEQVINRLTNLRIHFWDIARIDDFTYDISIRKQDWEQIEELVSRIQDGAELLAEVGILVHIRGIKKRAAFFAALVLILIASYILPCFIWCIRVEGNDTIPTQLILRELKELGIEFGTWGDSITPRDIKNRMIYRIPQIEWLTVNHSGIFATVIVRERAEMPEMMNQRAVTNLIASRDCVITSMEVLSGQPVCQVGQTIAAGELLVSGYADWEHCIQATMSLGEIFGRTWYRQNALTPSEYMEKEFRNQSESRYALILNGKRVNLYQSGADWHENASKHIEYQTFTLPGGHELPLTLVVETAYICDFRQTALPQSMAREILENGTTKAILEGSIAGEIQKSDLQLKRTDGQYCLTGIYECTEMIARSAPAILFSSENLKARE